MSVVVLRPCGPEDHQRYCSISHGPPISHLTMQGVGGFENTHAHMLKKAKTHVLASTLHETALLENL